MPFANTGRTASGLQPSCLSHTCPAPPGAWEKLFPGCQPLKLWCAHGFPVRLSTRQLLQPQAWAELKSALKLPGDTGWLVQVPHSELPGRQPCLVCGFLASWITSIAWEGHML